MQPQQPYGPPPPPLPNQAPGELPQPQPIPPQQPMPQSQQYGQPLLPQVPQQPAPQLPQNYEFIMADRQQPKTQNPLLGGLGKSMLSRVIIGLVGLIVIVVVLVAVKGLLGGSSVINQPSMLKVGQDQQELLHLAQGVAQTSEAAPLSVNSQNFVATLQISMTTAQNQLLMYLSTNGYKVNSKVLSAGISSSIDSQLTASVAASTYDSVFTQVMKAQLNDYAKDLKVAYANNKGPKGRAMLNNFYKGAQLLYQQINAPAS